MKQMIFVVTALAVFGLAFWAYRENDATRQVLKQTQALQSEIGTAQARLAMLRAEWAYLNRPDRLRDLTQINFATLGLLQLRPEQFGRVDEVAFPQPNEPLLEITNTVEVSAGERP